MKIVLVIPTYNEKNNLPILLEKIGVLSLDDWQAIIVDDNSPDGTGQLAESLSDKFPLLVIHRQGKQGLGSAYRAGFAKALELKPDYIVQMDADLSHQPEQIKDFLTAIDKADIVVGSRYIKGGNTENWSWSRKLISRAANFFVRFILRSKIHDLTSGFKMFRKDVLAKLDLSQTSSRGYNFQIEVSITAERHGYHLWETPITFIERRSGQSKFSLAIVIECAWRVMILAFKGTVKK